jgi:phosphoglycolate phosphatase
MSRVILFDLDGTLVDSLPDLAAALNRTLGSTLTVAHIRPMVGDGVAALMARALAHLGMKDDTALPRFLTDYEANAAVATQPFAGIVPTLDMLARAGWRMAVCTNKPEGAARALLDGLGLSSRFAAVGGGDSFPVRKPDPAHLLETLAAAGGGRAVMVGDHHNDVRGAEAAGIPSVFAGWGYGTPVMSAGATTVAATPAELPAALAAIIPG